VELRPNTNYPKSDPRYHTANVLATLDDLIRHLREDTHEFDEPKAQALFETSAEVLGGLRTAFQHYEGGAEAAMREPRGH
jgi:hypothetical protein